MHPDPGDEDFSKTTWHAKSVNCTPQPRSPVE
jgi:hypothetical protein